ncbi:MAG: BA14K family protein [Rhizobiaceae bacterium]|nr:BA14K family protein [Rhizobiaceae bacterium]
MLNMKHARPATALALAISVCAGTLAPVSSAFAHDRNNPGAHNGNYQNWNNRKHRRFHDRYGRGVRGERAFRQQQAKAAKRNRKSDKGDLIAAGIIGLAIGAVIAGSANSHSSNSGVTYNYPEPQYDPQPVYEPVPNRYQPQYRRLSDEPTVIRYEDTASLEPWTPGWRNWCEANYRSFNPSTGTFRGYDGLDHFCVPK